MRIISQYFIKKNVYDPGTSKLSPTLLHMVSDGDIKPLDRVIANEAVIGGQSAFAVPITVPGALQL